MAIFGKREIEADVEAIKQALDLNPSMTNYVRARMEVIAGYDEREEGDILAELAKYQKGMMPWVKSILEELVLEKFARVCGEGGVRVDADDRPMAKQDWGIYLMSLGSSGELDKYLP